MHRKIIDLRLFSALLRYIRAPATYSESQNVPCSSMLSQSMRKSQDYFATKSFPCRSEQATAQKKFTSTQTKEQVPIERQNLSKPMWKV